MSGDDKSRDIPNFTQASQSGFPSPVCVKTEPLDEDSSPSTNRSAGSFHKTADKKVFMSNSPQLHDSSATFTSPCSLPSPGYWGEGNKLSHNQGIGTSTASYSHKNPNDVIIKLEPESISNDLNSSEIDPEPSQPKAEVLSNISVAPFANNSKMKEKKKKNKPRKRKAYGSVSTNNLSAKIDSEPPQPKAEILSNISVAPFANDSKMEKKRNQNKREIDCSFGWNNCETSQKRQKYWPPFYGKHFCDAILITGPDRFISLEEENAKNLDVISNDMITNLLKCDLPSCKMKVVPEIDDISCEVKNYEWEKLVGNGFIDKIDDNIKGTVSDIIFCEDKYERGTIINQVIADLNIAVKIEKYENRWHCFSSYVDGSVYNDAVINVICECSSLEFDPHDLRQEMWACLSSDERFEKTNKTTTGITILEIQTSHINTGKKIHVTFSNPLDIRRFLLMKHFFSINPSLKYFIIYLKLVLKKFRVRIDQANLTHHTVFWLAVFFMQQKNLLPTVIDVRKRAAASHYVSGWDCSIPEDYSFTTEPVSLYSLMLGFFDFYKNSDYLCYVVSPYVGRVLTISDIETSQMPVDEFSVYLNQMRNPDQNTFCIGFLNIQDPTDLSRNLGNQLSADVLNEFKVVCHRLSESLPECRVVIEQIDCLCQMLPVLIDPCIYNPPNFEKYELFNPFNDVSFDQFKNKLNQCHILEAIRKLMVLIFGLEEMDIAVFQNYTRVESDSLGENTTRITVPVMHFKYCTSENTLKKDYMKGIVPEQELIRVYLRCEVRLEENDVRIFCETKAVFMDFLRCNFIKKFLFVLTEIMSP